MFARLHVGLLAFGVNNWTIFQVKKTIQEFFPKEIFSFKGAKREENRGKALAGPPWKRWKLTKYSKELSPLYYVYLPILLLEILKDIPKVKWSAHSLAALTQFFSRLFFLFIFNSRLSPFFSYIHANTPQTQVCYK